MKIVCLSILCLVIAFSLYSQAITLNSDDEYNNYLEQLTEEAIKNIDTLPSAVKAQYQSMLKEHRDIIMAFILAKEESSKLLLAEPQIVLSHYQEIDKLYQELENKYSIPFFLSYIAKITVTEERITPYRDLFRTHNLYDLREQHPELKDLVREVNLWTRRYMTFKPTSGRDMAPTDIMNRSNIGRCEEMMIYFISAARSLGIPARPASTPYWAHTDNNHAWVEVFDEGKWYHLGAVEPAYHLNDAWFSANAAKAIIITATAAFPDTSDIVVGKRGYSSEINSTPHYDSPEIRARTTYVITKDALGNIIPECPVSIQVFNWGSLRPILNQKTDENGFLELVTGNGSFFVSAAKDSLFALKVIPADIHNYGTELILEPYRNLQSFSTELHYRDHQLEKQPAPPGWDEQLKRVVSDYNDIVASYQELPFPQGKSDSLLTEVWLAARNNKDVFLKFYSERKPDLNFLNYLLKIDPKFLWQAEVSHLHNLYAVYLQVKDLDYPEEAILTLLSPTVFFEEIQRQPLKRSLLRWRKGKNRLENIIDFMAKSYTIENEKGVQSFQLPVDVLMDLPVLTSYQYRFLLVAVLKANHIPARYTRLPDVVSIYRDNGWRYYDIKNKTFLSSEKEETPRFAASIVINDEYGYPIVLDRSQFSLSIFRDGVFFPAESSFTVSKNAVLEANLETGNHYLHIGYRPHSGLTYYLLENINITKQPFHSTLTLEGYPRKWEPVPSELNELLTALNAETPAFNHYRYFLFGNHDREMVRRLSGSLIAGAEAGTYIWLGVTSSPDTPRFYAANEVYGQWLEQYPQYADMIITIFRDDEAKLTYFNGIWDRLPE